MFDSNSNFATNFCAHLELWDCNDDIDFVCFDCLAHFGECFTLNLKLPSTFWPFFELSNCTADIALHFMNGWPTFWGMFGSESTFAINFFWPPDKHFNFETALLLALLTLFWTFWATGQLTTSFSTTPFHFSNLYLNYWVAMWTMWFTFNFSWNFWVAMWTLWLTFNFSFNF